MCVARFVLDKSLSGRSFFADRVSRSRCITQSLWWPIDP